MGSFAVNRKQMNQGVMKSHGVWWFEEFMFSDSIFGSAEVAYDCSPDGKYIRVSFPRVTKLEVYDDDGNIIEISDEDRQKLSESVVDAWSRIVADVEEAEFLNL